MKKLIIINLILVSLFYIIPIPSEEVVIEQACEQVNVQVSEQVSNRSDEYRVQELPTVNLSLTVDSDLRIISNVSANDYNKMLEGTELAGLGSALEQAEKEHGVNGLYLMGLACLESGYRNI